MDYISNINNKWSELVYPGVDRVYHGIDVNAGSWPLKYFKKNDSGIYSKLSGENIALEIATPDYFDFQEELKVVEDVQKNITANEIAIAKFWGYGVPLNQWTPIILTLINTYKITPPRAGRIMSIAQDAIADGFVVCWDLKYKWDYPRPVQLNNNLRTVLATPKFPTYPSGHSVISSTVATVLSYFFPAESEKLYELAETASISRLYGGIHFPCDLSEGIRLGKQLGAIIVEEIKKQYDKDGAMIDIPKTEYLNAPITPCYCN